jgi:EmrB/QacA subfamily drug resistance transporter
VSDAAAAEGAAATSGFCRREARPWILAAAILSSALGFIDGSVVSIAMPAIRESLGASLAEAQWINNGYLLPLSALILAGGAAGDRFGLTRVLIAGIGVFLAASLASALAPSPGALIAARVLKGIGAALMVPGSLALIARAYPRAERGRAIGIWAAASAVTTALGPAVGGTVLSLGAAEAWRLIFALNLPLGAFVIWVLRTRVGHDPARSRDPIDWTGAALGTLALGSLAGALTALEDGGAAPVVLAIAGVAAAAAFLWRETVTAHPMVPLDLFRDPVFASANAATLCLYFGLSAILFYLPMTAIAAWGVSPLAASLTFAPLSVFIGVLSGPVGAWADRMGPGPLIATGSGLVAIAFAGMALGAPAQAFWSVVVPLACLMGLGMALVVGPLSTAVMAAVPDERTGVASGVNNAVSRMAGLVAVAGMGTLAALAYGAAGGPQSFGEPSDLAGHADASNAAFAAISWFAAALAALSTVVALRFLRPALTPSRSG